MNRDGVEVEHTPRSRADPVPRGPLTRRQVAALQALICGGLAEVGYSATQIGQVMRIDPKTVSRRLAAGPDRTTRMG